MRQYLCAVLTMVLAGCGSTPQDNEVTASEANQTAPINAAPAATPAPNAAEPASLPEPVIDPKSAQGAGQVVQHYAALIEQHRLAEAERLWSQASDARAFQLNLANYAEVHAEIGAPGGMEGAAGSAYVDVPVRFYGQTKGGESFSRPATATLRRVNDVPGSTEEQRRWHIQAIELSPA